LFFVQRYIKEFQMVNNKERITKTTYLGKVSR
jgi:hypothetical protein